MSIIVLDFETYYDREYSLSKITTEEYINDPRFEVIGYSIKIDDEPIQWFSGDHAFLKNSLARVDWAHSALVCHNARFDATILAWRFDIHPAFVFDTLAMARAIHGVDVSVSLKELASRLNLGVKGDEIVRAMGKHRKDFSSTELMAYGNYCCNDVNLTYKLFKELSKNFPSTELELINLTLRMFVYPSIQLDDARLVERLKELDNEKFQHLGTLKKYFNTEDEESIRKKLSSNKQFAKLLENFGIDPPLKISPTTGEETYALAKTDEGFIALAESGDPFVEQLCAVRLGTKSTMETRRIERFIQIGRRNRGLLPIPLNYYAAHTGRWGGADKINLQNLPTRDARKKTLKNSLVAPDGHVILNADSAQIEARILAWLANQKDVLELFTARDDIYSKFASKIFKRPVTKLDITERFVGKTCVLGLGYGTGPTKLQRTLKTTPPGADLSLSECQDIVHLYRDIHYHITDLWQQGDYALRMLMAWPREALAIDFGGKGIVHIDSNGIRLPNSMYIKYANLRMFNGKVIHDSRKGIMKIWGGTVVENIVQALARIIIGEQMLKIAHHYKVALTVHDSVVLVVPERDKPEAMEYTNEVMGTPPIWAAELPLACEVRVAQSYGEC